MAKPRQAPQLIPHQFKPGQSGNPAGRAKGMVLAKTQALEMLAARAPELVNKAIDMAMSGCAATMRLCIERIVPKPKDTEDGDGHNKQAELVNSMTEFVKALQEQHKKEY